MTLTPTTATRNDATRNDARCYWCDEPVKGGEPRAKGEFIRVLHRACGRRMKLGNKVTDPPNLTRRAAAERLDLAGAAHEGLGGW